LRTPRQQKKHNYSFAQWLPKVTPNWTWDWPHQLYIYSALQRVTDGETKRLMIFMPPRHTKTETVTVRYTAYRLEQDPEMNVILGSYNQHLANRFSRKIKRVVESRIDMSKDRNAMEEWETAKGGGFRAVGVGGGITGFGGDLIMIDDPVKSREEAESEVFRNKCWDWFNDDLYTRLEPDAAIILTMTRWHEDDLAGRLLEDMRSGGEKWEVVSLPAIAEEDDAMGRKVGEALCPDRYDLETLTKIKTKGSYSFDALYQQRPTAKSGSFFQVDKLQVVDAIPAGLEACRGWDQAATPGGGDYTAGVRITEADADGIFYVTDVVRGQWDTATRDRTIKQTAALDGVTTAIAGEQEGGSGGKGQAENFVRMLAGYSVSTEPSTGAKTVRADPFSSQVNAGNVKLLRGDWNRAYIDELRKFPLGKHDDQVDASAVAFKQVSTSSVGSFEQGMPYLG
jgi:predicted phage terminase large subunit-like protein